MASRSAIRDRYSFGNLDEVLELPDLIAIQRESFNWFLYQGLADAFRDISPIGDFTETLSLELEFDPNDEDLRPPPKFTVEECKEKDMTFSAPIFVRARFVNQNTGEIKEQTVFMGDFPMMTTKGTFIINGTERVVVSQLVRSPGVIFQPGERFRLRNLAKHQLVTGTIHPYRGEWIEFDVEQKPGKDVTAGTRVARKRRLSLFVLIRALGFDEENEPGFLDRFVSHFHFLEGQWEKEKENAPTQDEALVEIYKRARPGEPPTLDSARAYFRNAFFENRRYDLSRVGRYKLNRKLGPELDRHRICGGPVALQAAARDKNARLIVRTGPQRQQDGRQQFRRSQQQGGTPQLVLERDAVERLDGHHHALEIDWAWRRRTPRRRVACVVARSIGRRRRARSRAALRLPRFCRPPAGIV